MGSREIGKPDRFQKSVGRRRTGKFQLEDNATDESDLYKRDVF